MNLINKTAMLRAGIVSALAVAAVAGVAGSASADDVVDRCNGNVAIAANAHGDVGDARTIVLTPGQDQVVWVAPGAIRWFCNNPHPDAWTVHGATGPAVDSTARVPLEVQFGADGKLRISFM